MSDPCHSQDPTSRPHHAAAPSPGNNLEGHRHCSTAPESDSTRRHFDLVILGTGSGNSIPGPEFADRSVAIVEEGRFGGTCLNVGCIPTKMYVLAADTARTVREARRLGVAARVDSIDWPGIVDRVFHRRIDPIADSGEAYRRGPETPNIDVFDRHAEFIGPRTLRTGQGEREVVISGDQVVIATGSRPLIPRAIADSGVAVHTNEDIMRLERLPESLIVIGGGYIAMEFAHVFAAFGTKVTVVNRSQTMLRHLDDDISRRFNDLLRKEENIEVVAPAEVTALRQPDRTGPITATLTNGHEVAAEHVLVATGRVPNSDLIGAEAGGIELVDGRVAVDAYGRSISAEGVWALGDVESPAMLKHVANAEARAIAHNLLHPGDLRRLPHTLIPSAIFTHPQIATVGLTEKQARQAGHDVVTATQEFGDVAYGWALEDTTGVVKLVADRATGRLLGSHIMGPQAPTLIQELITVMAFDIPVAEAARGQYWIHPALPEVLENALLGLGF